MKKKIAYIAHPIGGDVINNLNKIHVIVRTINLKEPKVVPFVPYYADVVSLDDNNPIERQRGIENGHTILESGIVDELRLYGAKISPGMKAEIELAVLCNIPVKACSSEIQDELIQLIKR
jgi:hypothetical protein